MDSRSIFLVIFLHITLFSLRAAASDLVFQIRLAGGIPGSNLFPQYCLPIGTSPRVVSIRVDWGDGTTPQEVGLSDLAFCGATTTKGISHNYASLGNYNITVSPSGSGPTWLDSFGTGADSNATSISPIEAMYSFGDLGIIYLDGAFDGAASLMSVPKSLPATVVSTARMFRNCAQFNQNIASWDTSRITNMEAMFEGATRFNQPLNGWSVSSVENMKDMFHGALSFDQPLNKWLVSNVETFRGMFHSAAVFNHPLTTWDVSGAADFSHMFHNAIEFSEWLDGWNTTSATSMAYMFAGSPNFNMPLQPWDVKNVRDMSHMFDGAISFNQPLAGWDVSSVQIMDSMFRSAVNFNQELWAWNVRNVISMNYMFEKATSFNAWIDSWDVSGVTSMVGCFKEAGSFNQPLGSWNVHRVNYFNETFFGAVRFNQILEDWNVSSAVSLRGTFRGAERFNTPIGIWNVSGVEDFSHLFQDAPRFNQPLDEWDVSSSRDMSHMFDGATLFNTSIDMWNVSRVESMAWMFSRASRFSQPIGRWDVGRVTSFSGMFAWSVSFSQSLSEWDTRRARAMDSMFRSAVRFDSYINSWNICNVTDMAYMFANASKFHGSLYHWCVIKVQNMDFMFYGAYSFAQSLRSWCPYAISAEPVQFADERKVSFPKWGSCYPYPPTYQYVPSPRAAAPTEANRSIGVSVLGPVLLGLVVASPAVLSHPFWHRRRRQNVPEYIPLEDIGTVDSVIHDAASNTVPGQVQLPSDIWQTVFGFVPDSVVFKMSMTDTRWLQLQKVWPTLPNAAKNWKAAVDMCEHAMAKSGVMNIISFVKDHFPNRANMDEVFITLRDPSMRYIRRSHRISQLHRDLEGRLSRFQKYAKNLESACVPFCLASSIGGFGIVLTSVTIGAATDRLYYLASLLSVPLFILISITQLVVLRNTVRRHVVKYVLVGLFAALGVYGGQTAMYDSRGRPEPPAIILIVIICLNVIGFFLQRIGEGVTLMVEYLDPLVRRVPRPVA